MMNPKSGGSGNTCASAVDSNPNVGWGEAMVCSSTDFAGWSDFPKGLRILLLDRDDASAAETKWKLEQMDYVVSLFSSEKEALEAILGRTDRFHVAIVEVNATNNQESFAFLQTAGGLPTVMVSNGNCLSTMMRCIALGAAEILQKPLSEEKIKNIWQHAVHKAFNAGENALPKSLKPIRETVSTMFEVQPDTSPGSKNANGVPEDGKPRRGGSETERENRSADDGLPSPSTPQGICSLDAGDSRGPSSYSSAEHECEAAWKDTADFTFGFSTSKFADNACDGSNGDGPREQSMKIDPKESATSSDSKSEHFLESTSGNPVELEPSPNHVLDRGGRKNGKKKTKVDWTAELHRRFVQAVEQLGIDQAIPSKILALMKVEGLTRHNIASHLQKYRMQRKNALPKDRDRWWQLHRRDPSSRVYARKPVLAVPPPRSNFGYPPPYPAWGHPQFHPSSSQMWGHAGFYPWHQGSWPCKSHTRWDGFLFSRFMLMLGAAPSSPRKNDYSTTTAKIPQNVLLNKIIPDHHWEGGNIHEPQLREDVIDEVLKEAISKPWLPLPIGLKPPSMDSVVAELQRQGSIPLNPSHRPRGRA